MKKVLLFKSAMVLLFIASFFSSSAQNWSLIGPRLLVNSPAPVAGFKEFGYSFDNTHTVGSTTNPPWGGDITQDYLNRPLMNSKPQDGCTALTNTSDFTGGGKWALIERGSCQFSDKAFAAQNAGAEGCIIFNWRSDDEIQHMAGGTVAASVTIPVLFISHEDGIALWSLIDAGTAVNISIIHQWGFNNTHDLAFMFHSNPCAHGGAIPYSQMGTSTPYNFYNGGIIANTGTSTETNVTITNNIYFTPAAGGASTLVLQDTVIDPSFPAIDSLHLIYSTTHKNYSSTQIGRYNFEWRVKSDAVDQQPLDNLQLDSFYVTPTAFAKGHFNPITNKPIIRGANVDPTANTAGTSIVWGPMYYVTHGGYTVDSIAMAVFDNDITAHDLSGDIAPAVYIYKWVDNVVVDNVMQPAELTLVGTGNYVYTTNDSNLNAYSVVIHGPSGSGTMVTENNTWYWVTAEMASGMFLGVDNRADYFGNASGARKNAPTAIKDYWAPEYRGDFASLSSDIAAASQDTLFMYPLIFQKRTAFDPIDSLFNPTFCNTVPNIAMYLSQFPTAVSNIHQTNIGQINLFPNPAVDHINVNLELTASSASVTYTITDLFGKTIATETRTNVTKDQISFSTKNMASGQYMMIVKSDNGTDFKKFEVISK